MDQRQLRRCVAVAAAIGLTSACVTPSPPSPWQCTDGTSYIDAAFDGGAVSACASGVGQAYVLTIKREDTKVINPSPWYAFRVTGPVGTRAKVVLKFTDAPARYWPKISTDRRSWTRLGEHQVQRNATEASLTFEVIASPTGTYVAGQEVHDAKYWAQWRDQLAAHPGMATHVVGQSRDGHPMYVFDTANDARDVLVLLGRQHPPEITGTLAMRTFLDVLLSERPLAKDFRAKHRLIIAPWINPDGVSAGHWRHNLGRVDLNRDWGPFTQPETRSVYAYIKRVLNQPTQQPALMLDFHSTRRNLFYTQEAADFAVQPDLATAWFAAARPALGDFEFSHEANPTSDQPNSKNFFFKTYGCPAITYELGDETDRATIARVTPIFAESLMRLLLSRQ